MASSSSPKTDSSVESDSSSLHEEDPSTRPEAERQWRSGYDCQFIGEIPPPDVGKCPKCRRIYSDPHQMRCCGKRICGGCVEKIKAKSQPCHFRNCNEVDVSSYPDKAHMQYLGSYKVNCPNSSEGCEWEGQLAELDRHLNLEPTTEKQLKGCQFSKIKCKFHAVGCQVELLHKDMPEHERQSVAEHSVALSTTLQKAMEDITSLKGEMQALVANNEQTTGAMQDSLNAMQERITAQSTRLWRGVAFLAVVAIVAVLAGVVRMRSDQHSVNGIQYREDRTGFCRFDDGMMESECIDKKAREEWCNELDSRMEHEQKERRDELDRRMEQAQKERRDELDRRMEQAQKKRRDELDRRMEQAQKERRDELDRRMEQAQKERRDELDSKMEQEQTERRDELDRRMEQAQKERRDELDSRMEQAQKERHDELDSRMEQEQTERRDELDRRMEQAQKERRDELDSRMEQEQTERHNELDRKVEEVLLQVSEYEAVERQERQRLQGQLSELQDQLDQDIKTRQKTDIKHSHEVAGVDVNMLQVRQNAILKHLRMFPHEDILPFEFEMKEFKKNWESGNLWYSPPFYTDINGYKMCICVEARGKDGKYVSVTAFLMAGVADDDLKWPFREDITIELMNQASSSRWNPLSYFRSKKESHFKTFQFKTTRVPKSNRRVTSGERALDGLRISRFIAHDNLENDSEEGTQYLKDDTLKFRISASSAY